MKTKIKFIVIIIGVIFYFSEITAQTKWEKSKHSKFENFDFGFDFRGLKMSLEEEKKILKEVKANLRDQLKTIKKNNQYIYYELLRESKFKNMDFPFMKKNNEEEIERAKRIFELEVASQAHVAKYKNANTSKKQKLKVELEKILNKLFDLKEEERKLEVKELENELYKLKKSLSIRMKNKKDIVKRRSQELLDEDDYLEWE